MKYKLCDWEDNGYHDSYFYGVYFDTEDNALHDIGLGATAYGGGIGFGAEYELPTPEILEKARLQLEDLLFQAIKRIDHKRVHEPEPQAFSKGMKAITLDKVRFQIKKQENCPKCNGSGYWVNPQNKLDKRQCFACYGYGLTKGEKVLGDNGKPTWGNIPKGEELNVIGEYKFFGTVYRNGYNRPNRFNSTIPCYYNGQIVNVACAKLKLSEPVLDDETLREQARQTSYGHDYGHFFGCRAWLSNNWALEAQQRISRKSVSK